MANGMFNIPQLQMPANAPLHERLGAMAGGMLGAIPMGMAQQFMAEKQQREVNDIMGVHLAEHPNDPGKALKAASMDFLNKGDFEKGANLASMASQMFDIKLAEQKQELAVKRWKTEDERVKAYNKYLGAQADKWKADQAAGGNLPSSTRSLVWANAVQQDPGAYTPAEQEAAKQVLVNLSKPIKDIPSKNFMTFVDKQLANRSFGNQKLKDDMDPTAYGKFVSEVALLAHQMRSDNPKLSMKDSIETAWSMSQPMLKEQPWWKPGPDIELVRGQGPSSKKAEGVQSSVPGRELGEQWSEGGTNYRINPDTGKLQVSK